MIRNIYCPKCGHEWKLNPLDEDKGLRGRRVQIMARKPEVHHITINGVPQEEMKSLRCDLCGDWIPDNTPAVAITIFTRGQKVPDWESEFGTVVEN